MRAMRMRFSLRLLFVVTALSAVALYVFYVRPTAIAGRFVSAVERHDYNTAQSLLNGRELLGLHFESGMTGQADAELLPLEWEDICKCRRKLTFRITQHREDDDNRGDRTIYIDLVAQFDGLKIAKPGIDLSNMKPFTIELPAQIDPFRVPDYTLVP
jgi:hypothetical protein